ncbi:GTP-binding protein Rhes-like protein [Leptotrombidium deliense]|uniref:GTP-binding protein Rhes-like protein n=1 Tax=Leptotrombidium deliense TaxID=299467 RepID=A0A443SJ48_9ACAR|nr:GTP-binding protein Rhes-like protein [Leptotrombidium deliense]
MPSNSVDKVPRFGSAVTASDAKLDYKIIIMGAAGVGKTAIVQQFLYEIFPVEHIPTVEELHRAEFELKGTGKLVLDILDTSGTYQFPAMRQLAINNGDAFILVYSIDNADSFEEVRRLKDAINGEWAANGQKVPPIVVAGNKTDVEEKRVVKKELAETVIAIDWEIGFSECSAIRNENVLKIFQKLLVQARTPYALSSNMIKKRRQSLPNYPLVPFKEKEATVKRNSCAVS